jgi:excisionase family DNA binding protein
MRERLLTIHQVADRLAISVRTLESMIARGEAPPHLRISKMRRWDPAGLDAWISGNRQALIEHGSAPLPSTRSDTEQEGG